MSVRKVVNNFTDFVVSESQNTITINDKKYGALSGKKCIGCDLPVCSDTIPCCSDERKDMREIYWVLL